ncbi:MAG: hypothetical protein ABIN97_20880 [Ginsengibacter sp.]
MITALKAKQIFKNCNPQINNPLKETYMILIENDALIIKIPCGENEKPLACLADLQRGLILTLRILDHSMLSDNDFQFSLVTLSDLLKEILISQDQLCHINRDFSPEQMEDFNKWAE